MRSTARFDTSGGQAISSSSSSADPPNGTVLHGYMDADWATDVNNRKSTSGFVFMLGGAAISWGSKKQTSVALSSTEAEYIATAHAAKEAVWLRR
jgi:hypothetical protein